MTFQSEAVGCNSWRSLSKGSERSVIPKQSLYAFTDIACCMELKGDHGDMTSWFLGAHDLRQSIPGSGQDIMPTASRLQAWALSQPSSVWRPVFTSCQLCDLGEVSLLLCTLYIGFLIWVMGIVRYLFLGWSRLPMLPLCERNEASTTT